MKWEILNECFANRSSLCKFDTLDDAVKEAVQDHFRTCKACKQWAKKHNMTGKLLDTIRYYCGQAKVFILHNHKRKAQIQFLEEHDQIFGIDKVNRVRHFNVGETCVTLTRLLWHKRRVPK